jgi:hypothetical protein
MAELTDVDLHALERLAEKKAGAAIPFVNISAARKLSDMGLAQRSGEGWDITPEGSALLARRAEPPSSIEASDDGSGSEPKS